MGITTAHSEIPMLLEAADAWDETKLRKAVERRKSAPLALLPVWAYEQRASRADRDKAASYLKRLINLSQLLSSKERVRHDVVLAATAGLQELRVQILYGRLLSVIVSLDASLSQRGDALRLLRRSLVRL